MNPIAFVRGKCLTLSLANRATSVVAVDVWVQINDTSFWRPYMGIAVGEIMREINIGTRDQS